MTARVMALALAGAALLGRNLPVERAVVSGRLCVVRVLDDVVPGRSGAGPDPRPGVTLVHPEAELAGRTVVVRVDRVRHGDAARSGAVHDGVPERDPAERCSERLS